jgi:transmembrane sensor
MPVDRQSLLSRLAPELVPFRAAATEPGEPRTGAPRRARIAGAIAAAVLLASAILLPFSGLFPRWATLETGFGEQRSFPLQDGSVVTLSPRSGVQVRFGRASRDIRLVEGQALFSVAHDPARPFRVNTRDVVVQAVGTEFDVAARLSGTRVAVIDGRVQVTARSPDEQPLVLPAPKPSTNAPDTVPMQAGETVYVTRQGSIVPRPTFDATNAAQWRQGRLVFEKTPLDEVVLDFNRYNKFPQLRLEGVEPGSYHYSGTFDARDVGAFANLLSREPGLIVERSEDEIVIRARR